MEIKIAKTAGFCTGVQRAVNILLDTARLKDPPIYTFGPLIHNPQVIAMLEQRGITALTDPDAVPKGTVVIRAHGIPPKTKKQLKKIGFKICDATCPHVAQVQSIVKSHSTRGYHIVIIGDNGHAEVVGILGFANGLGSVINSFAEIESLPPGIKKLCIVAQTTQNVSHFKKISQKIQSKYEETKIFNTICNSTYRRQEEALKIAGEVEAMIVVGGENSANTVRLAKMTAALPKPTFHIETVAELKIEELKKYDRLGITAGASTPNWIIEEVIEKLISLKQHKANFIMRYLFQGLRFLDRSDLFIAIGAFSISYAAALLQGIRPTFPLLIIPALYVFAMYLSNHLLDKNKLGSQDLVKIFHLSSYSSFRLILAMTSLILALSLSINLGLYPFLFLLLASIGGIVYSIPLIPREWQVHTQFRRLKDIPASKDIFLAGAWASIAVGIPLLCGIDSTGIHTAVCLLFIITIVFIRSVLQDIRDIQEDRIVGRETLPIIIGQEKIKLLLFFISLPSLILLFLAGYLGWTTSLSYFLSLCIFFPWIYMLFSDTSYNFDGITSKLIIDSNFIFCGLIALFWSFFF